jgi:NAD(P)-dependent dehydrogenase (short-subunit alcohol dehydrogenase family)
MKKPQPKPAAPTSRVALVTGAADRIGAAIAERLAADGWKVVVHYRSSAEKARATLSRIKSAGGTAALARADLASRRQRAGLIAAAGRHFGPLTLLVNNASIFEKDAAWDIDENLWDAHFAVHAEAPAFLSRDFAAQLPAGTEGNIVNLVDERVLHLSPSNFSYTLSKSVLWTMTVTMAQTFAPRIRVNAIGPGPTVAERDQSAADFDRSWTRLPLGRGADAAQVAEGVLAILRLPAVTGQMLALDGGEHIEWPERRGPTPRQTSGGRPDAARRSADTAPETHSGRLRVAKRLRNGAPAESGGPQSGNRTGRGTEAVGREPQSGDRTERA